MTHQTQASELASLLRSVGLEVPDTMMSVPYILAPTGSRSSIKSSSNSTPSTKSKPSQPAPRDTPAASQERDTDD